VRRVLLIFALALLPLSGGCTRVVPGSYLYAVRSDAHRLIWSANIAAGEPEWRSEIKANLPPGTPEPFLFVCHGGDDKDGVWCAWPDLVIDGGDPIPEKYVARMLKAMLPPGTPIYFVSCNASGRTLGVPGVHYARHIVRTFPYTGWQDEEVTADRFEDFVTDPPRPPAPISNLLNRLSR
jgi:hypothetical protein